MRDEAVLRYAEYRKKTSGYWLLLVAPFIALVLALRNYNYSWSKNLVWLFIVFYGYTFIISSKQLDSDRYVTNLKELSTKQAETLEGFSSLLYNEETTYVDIVQPLLTFIISRFTSDGRVLFAFFGLIFGYFYSRNLWYLFSFVEKKIGKEALPFLALSALIIAIWQINGFRFWTAAHIFIYGIFLYADGSKIKGLLICVLSISVHFSFAIPVIVLAIYLVVGNRLFIYFLVYFSSFFVTQINPELLRNYSSNLPKVFQERADRYTSKGYLELRLNPVKRGNWYAEYRTTALIYSVNLLLVVIFFKYRRAISETARLKELFSYSLLLLSTSNILTSVPSVGVRFTLLGLMLLFSALFIFTQRHNGSVFSFWVKAPFLLMTILYCVVEIRVGFDTIGLVTIVGNPLIAPFVENDIPLIQLIK